MKCDHSPYVTYPRNGPIVFFHCPVFIFIFSYYIFGRCIIAMGLDKKPFPPKKKLADADEEKKDFRGKKVRYKLSDNSISTEETKDSVSTSSSPPEEEREFSGSSLEMEMETQRLKRARIKWERNLRSIPDYGTV